MAEIEIPFVDEEVDTSNPTRSVMTIALLVAGFAVFAMASDIGGYVGSRINSFLGGILGFNPGTGESTENDLV
jgi:hypothetical protein